MSFRSLTALFVLIAIPLLASTARAVITPPPPQIEASAYVLMDATSGTILVAHDADHQLPPASLTKLMTAYIATLEIRRGQVKESDLVTISEGAWRMGGSKMFVKVGNQVSVGNLLHGIIIQSGNDASVALAEHLAGSESSFAALMNAHAKRLGMRNTHFENATGWPAPGHLSTARDLALLARAIIYEDPAHYALYAQREFTWNGIRQPNRNLLLERFKGADGLKTGHTEEAGYCLVSSAKQGNERLIAVVLGTKSDTARATEAARLLTYGFRFFESKVFYRKGKALVQVSVWKGAEATVAAGIDHNLALTLPRGELKTASPRITYVPRLMAPIKAGQIIGKVEIVRNGKVLAKSDLKALGAVAEAGWLGRLWDSLRLSLQDLLNGD
jgi:D-alanyl-D-alanine carboxypeptidase (penicillin-binding protein 5/6)